VHHHDGFVGELDSRIVLGDGGVVPVGDLAQADVGDHLGAELQVPGDARHVVSRHHRAQHRGDVEDRDLGLAQLLVGHGTVAGAEIHRALQHLADAAAAADGLVVDGHVGMLVVILAEPLGVDGIRERGARRVQIGLGQGGRHTQEQKGEKQDSPDQRSSSLRDVSLSF
jgi:hypothetical protein